MDLSIPVGGMQTETTAFDTAARGIARSFLPPSNNSMVSAQGTATDSLDLSASVVELLQAKLGFESDVRTAKVEDEMNKSTLSILG